MFAAPSQAGSGAAKVSNPLENALPTAKEKQSQLPLTVFRPGTMRHMLIVVFSDRPRFATMRVPTESSVGSLFTRSWKRLEKTI